MSDDALEAEATTPRPRGVVAKRPAAPPLRMAAQPAAGDPTVAGVRGPRPASAADVLDNLPTRALPGGPDHALADARRVSPLLRPGDHVGRYLLVEHVGSGGLGDVYKAYDPELDRRIAVKLLRAEVVDANRRLGDPTARLRREAQALAKLRHPNVVTVHDVGTHQGGVFIAMEFAHGETLLPWARAQGHDWRAIRSVFVKAGEGLAAAHAAGLVHRDFKPANVVVGRDDRVTVLDFGLARAADASVSDDDDESANANPDLDPRTAPASLLSREVTGGSLLLGTPPYMAPELFDGSAATTLSDQFAFCVALYRVLFNRLPFIADSSTEYCEAIARGELSFAGNQVPRWLTRVIARGLRAAPSERFADMPSLLSALQTDRRRRRRLGIGLSILLPLGGLSVAAATWALRPPPSAEQRQITEALATDARTAAARGYYVHPPAEAPDTATALTKVLELEGLQGPIAGEAEALAQSLRDEFAHALKRLGDRYYERDGGAPFAADFYAAALVFVPDDPHAAGRVALSDAQIATLVRQAQDQSFSPRELAAAEPLAILASERGEARAQKLERFLARDGKTPARTRMMLEGLVRSEATSEPRGPRDRSSDDLEPSVDQTPPALDVHDVLVDPEALAADKPVPAPADGEGAPGGAVDRKRARTEALSGKAALAQGDLAAAATYFHRALAHDRKNITALTGLVTVHYERGEYDQAIGFANRGLVVAPRSHKLLLLKGDAFFKEVNYAAARQAYERADELGSKKAPGRLARLTGLLAEPR